jgi:60 kDa SS-A/Ro ribonucleoprotein
MANYARHVSSRSTPQTEKIAGKEHLQKRNNAGGVSFVLDDWQRLSRFLILGSEGGTYYVGERKLTRDNAKCIERCLGADAKRTVDTIAEISVAGRAPKNSPAIFALALAVQVGKTTADRDYALTKVKDVCRTGTHILEFSAALHELGRWRRPTVRAVGDWYTSKKPEDLVYQVIKYGERGGWSHRDVLRQAHPKAEGKLNDVLRYAVGKLEVEGRIPSSDPLGRIWARGEAMRMGDKLGKDADVKALCKLIEEYNLPREALPTQAFEHKEVWETMLPRMPLTALIRNLGKMTSLGMVGKLSTVEKTIVGKLSNAEALRGARVHPVALLVALKTYAQGKGVKGKLTWSPAQRVVDALDDAFYASFGFVRPTGKSFLFGIDVSGSMSAEFSNMPLRMCEASAAMAMVTARVEKNYAFMGFCDRFVELKISPKMRLDAVANEVQKSNFGRCCGPPSTTPRSTSSRSSPTTRRMRAAFIRRRPCGSTGRSRAGRQRRSWWGWRRRSSRSPTRRTAASSTWSGSISRFPM